MDVPGDRPNGVWDMGSAEVAEMAKLAEVLGSLQGLCVAVLGAACRGGVQETAWWACPAGGGAPVA